MAESSAHLRFILIHRSGSHQNIELKKFWLGKNGFSVGDFRANFKVFNDIAEDFRK